VLLGDPRLVPTATTGAAGGYTGTAYGSGAGVRCDRGVGGAVRLVVHGDDDVAAAELVVPVAALGVPRARARPVPELGRGRRR